MDVSVANSPTASAVSRGGRLFATGFTALLALRVLTVVNDNLLRWLAIGLGKRVVLQEQQSLVLMLGTAGFVLPFVLLAWLSGWLADRYPKRAVIQWCKFAEIVIAGAAAAVIAFGVLGGAAADRGTGWPLGLWLLLGTLIAIGCQAALLAPAILGTIPESVPPERLSAANGMFAMLTLVATLVGTAGGNWLADATPLSVSTAAVVAGEQWRAALPAALSLIGVAVAGWGASFLLVRRPAADPTARPPVNALGRTWTDLRELFSSPDLSAAAAGSAFFWALGAMANLNVDQFVAEGGSSSQSQVVPFLCALGAGIGAGSLLAGRLSARGVNLGLVPCGAILMTIASVGLWLGPRPLFVDGLAHGWAWWPALAALLVLGLGAGMFDVPLEAHFQQQSPPARRGALLASLNLLVFAAMFLASLVYGAARTPVGDPSTPLLSARGVFGGFALMGLLATAVAVWCAPRASLRTLVAGIVSGVWRWRVRDEDRLPAEGPVVVVSNHLSWLDGFALVLATPRPLRMLVFGPNIRGRFLRMLARQWRFILFDPRPKSIGQALRTMQQGLAAGDVVGIFSEGGISRTGQILGFKRGLEWILGRVEAPIVPAHIDGMWGSVLSYSEGRFFSKWPRGFRRSLTISFGDPLPVGTPPHEARLALQELTAVAVRSRMLATRDPDRELAAWLRANRGRNVAIAADGTTTTGRGLDLRPDAVHRLAAALAAIGGGTPLDLRSGRPLLGSVEKIPGGRRGNRPIAVDDQTGRWLDWATLAAGAEAFVGGCLVRREDRLLGSLAAGDPLSIQFGLLGGPLLGIGAVVADPGLPAPRILRAIREERATIWLARIDQVLQAAASEERPGDQLQAVVMPVATADDLLAARRAAELFRATFGIEPVVAFAPSAAAGLVAMNSPPARSTVDHELTNKPETLGRIVNGAVLWQDAIQRRRLGRRPMECVPIDGDALSLPLLIGAVCSRPAGETDSSTPVACTLGVGHLVDDDGFVLPPAAA